MLGLLGSIEGALARRQGLDSDGAPSPTGACAAYAPSAASTPEATEISTESPAPASAPDELSAQYDIAPASDVSEAEIASFGALPQPSEWADAPPRRGQPAEVSWTTPESVRLELTLPSAAWALLQRALEGARLASGRSLSDAQALEAVARDALARQQQAAEPGEPRRQVVLSECRHCARAAVETGAGTVELDAAQAGALACGAPVIDRRDAGTIRRGPPLPAALKQAVLARDGSRCRVPGCGRRRYVDVHAFGSAAGGDAPAPSRCVTLCTLHHGQVHAGELKLQGDADAELRIVGRYGPVIDPFADVLAGELASSPGREAGAAPSASCEAGERSTTGQPSGTGHSPASATHGGSPPAADPQAPAAGLAGPVATTHGGSPPDLGEEECEDEAAPPDTLASDARRLLGVMGARGGWHVDALCGATGLGASRVLGALTLLQIAGHARRVDLGCVSTSP